MNNYTKKSLKIKSNIKLINNNFILYYKDSSPIQSNISYKLQYNFIDEQFTDSDDYVSLIKYKFIYDTYEELLSKIGEIYLTYKTLKNSTIIFDSPSSGYVINNIKVTYINNMKNKPNTKFYYNDLKSLFKAHNINEIRPTDDFIKSLKDTKLKIKVELPEDNLILNESKYKWKDFKKKEPMEYITLTLFKSVISSLETGPYDIKIKSKLTNYWRN